MSVSISRIQAIFIFKMKSILTNIQMIVPPLMGIFFVVLMDSLMPDSVDMNGFTKAGFLLGFGLLFTSIMGGMMMACYPIAEEKEKNTLRVLMTSSVTGGEFLIGSTAPAFLILELVNILLVPISGTSFKDLSVVAFLLISSMVVLISLLIGLTVGLIAKTQMSAGLLLLPFMLLLMMLPNFRMFNQTLNKVSQYFYSGVLANFFDATFGGKGYHWNGQDILVLLAWFIVAVLVFLYFYRKNGLDNE